MKPNRIPAASQLRKGKILAKKQPTERTQIGRAMTKDPLLGNVFPASMGFKRNHVIESILRVRLGKMGRNRNGKKN